MSTAYRVVASLLTAIAVLGSNALAESMNRTVLNVSATAPSIPPPPSASAVLRTSTKVYVPANLLKPHLNLGPFRAIAAAQAYRFVELLNAPSPSGINNRGVISNTSGIAKDPYGYTIAPPYATANIKRIIPLGSASSSVYAINQNGDVAGSSKNVQSTGIAFGFFQLANGTSATGYMPQISVHVNTSTVFYGGNSHGVLIGDYTDTSVVYGFVYHIEDLASVPLSSGSYYVLIPPGSNGQNVVLTGVNERDDVVGYVFNSSNEISFMSQGYATTEFSIPGAMATAATGINNSQEIVGQFTDSGGFTHGFTYAGGKYGRVDYPGANATSVTGVNDNGDLVGVFSKNGEPFLSHGFIAAK